MGDYGHDLAFGTFITPLNARPQDVVALAQTTERAGLDLVTFQDHPSALLDTWTLLTWVAAKTERVHLSAQPAVACNPGAGARGGELDLLSGDRFELGVGAGGFWDAIVAMGGEPRTPGQSVDALGEAIDVIRAIWSPGERGGVLIEGEHYRIRGAKRGPEPAHDIQIWPRRPQATDAAAGRYQGRRRAIRRLLNVAGVFARANGGFLRVPLDQWVEELLPLAIEDGVSTFIAASDDPQAIAIWGGDVAPALREAVARERQVAGTSSTANAPRGSREDPVKPPELAVQRLLRKDPRLMPDNRPRDIAPLRAGVDHVRGRPAARLMLEYGDYECPYSRQALKGANSRVASCGSEGWEDRRCGLLLPLSRLSGSAWGARAQSPWPGRQGHRAAGPAPRA